MVKIGSNGFVRAGYSGTDQLKKRRRTTKPTPRQVRKRTTKFLAVVPDAKLYSATVKKAPDSVIKSICDAALNVKHGEGVSLSDAEQALFRRHRAAIDKLTSKNVSVASKRKLLTQRGGFAFIPALIGSALGFIGSKLFGGNGG